MIETPCKYKQYKLIQCLHNIDNHSSTAGPPYKHESI